MAKSLSTKVEEIRRAVEAVTAEEQLINARIILCETREQALQLQSLPPVAPPSGPKIRLTATGPVTASDYLAERGIVAPPRQNSE